MTTWYSSTAYPGTSTIISTYICTGVLDLHKSSQSSHSVDSFHRIEFTSILNDAEFVMPKVESLQERDEKSLVIAHTYGHSSLNPSEEGSVAAVASK